MTKVAIISTVRAPLAELKRFVNYHLNIGVDEIYLFFDDPADEAIEVFKQNPRVNVTACDDNYWIENGGSRPEGSEDRQFINVNKGMKLTRERQYDWIIHIDHDELIHPLTNLKQELTRCKTDVLRFDLMEAVSEQVQYESIFSPKLFKKLPNRINIRLAKLLGCRKSMFNNEYFRGHRLSKAAVRLSDSIVSMSNHGVHEHRGEISRTISKNLVLLHYDCVGFTDWKRKWQYRLDGSGRANNMRGNRLKQFQAFSEKFKGGDDELLDLYQEIQFIPKHEKAVLYSLNLLSKVELAPELFKPLSDSSTS